MKLEVGAVGAASIVAVALVIGGCSSGDDESSSSPTSTAQVSPMRSSVAATASSAVNSALDSVEQGVQNTINKVLTAAPITFDPGSSDLGATLKAVAAALQGNGTKIEVTTYAKDSNPATAASLAKSRGDNIVAELESDGIDKSRITLKSDGNPSDSSINADQAKITVVDA
ncbi:OmpA family protein [Nocardia thailandica]|uniref:OmpA family protein n=1 Tax=Nocardia thailandica TaxID=257275 RepID=UPI0002FBF168|nr:OmpA family protein [Nocardia thailandica]